MAVNAAIVLERPLLVKGGPGTGKTVLAGEVAAALGAFRSSNGTSSRPLARFPAKWNHFAERESRQINNLEHVLFAKVFHTLAGHALGPPGTL